MLAEDAEKLVENLVSNQIKLVNAYQTRISGLLADSINEENLPIIKSLSESFYHSSVILKELINIIDESE